MQSFAALRTRHEHGAPLPEHFPDRPLVPGDRLLHQLLLQHLRLLQHGLQVPRDDESALLQREDHDKVEELRHTADHECQCNCVLRRLCVDIHAVTMLSLWLLLIVLPLFSVLDRLSALLSHVILNETLALF